MDKSSSVYRRGKSKEMFDIIPSAQRGMQSVGRDTERVG